MSQKTDSQLQTQALQIKSEVVEKANTAARVGTMLQDIIDSKANNDLLLTDWDMSSDALPANSKRGRMYYGINGPTSEDLVIVIDGEEQVIPDAVIAISLIDNAAVDDPKQWAFIVTIKQDA